MGNVRFSPIVNEIFISIVERPNKDEYYSLNPLVTKTISITVVDLS